MANDGLGYFHTATTPRREALSMSGVKLLVDEVVAGAPKQDFVLSEACAASAVLVTLEGVTQSAFRGDFSQPNALLVRFAVPADVGKGVQIFKIQ